MLKLGAAGKASRDADEIPADSPAAGAEDAPGGKTEDGPSRGSSETDSPTGKAPAANGEAAQPEPAVKLA